MNDENMNESAEPVSEVEETVAEEAVEEIGVDEFVADVSEPSDETAGESSAESEGVAEAAWHDVIAQLDGLAEAAGRWTRAAVDDPENRERAVELRDHIEKMASELGDTVDGAVSDAKAAEVSQSIKDAATKTGDAFKSAGVAFTSEVAPRMATAFRGAAEGMNRAAEKMERPSPPPPPPGDTPGEVETTDAADNDEPRQVPAGEASE